MKNVEKVKLSSSNVVCFWSDSCLFLIHELHIDRFIVTVVIRNQFSKRAPNSLAGTPMK